MAWNGITEQLRRMSLTNVGDKRVWVAFISVFILTFALYIHRLPSFATGIADSDELLGTSYLAGVAHPPGYSLLIMLGYVFTHLPLGSSVAFGGHLLSAFFQSLSVAMVFLITHNVLNLDKRMKKYPNVKIFSAMFGSLLLGVSYLYWFYSQTLEVFPLANFLFLVVVWQSILLLVQPKKATLVKMILYGIVVGLMVSHHQLSWLYLPILLYVFIVVWKNNKSYKLLMASFLSALFVLVLLFYSLIPLQRNGASMQWDFEPTIAGVASMFFRSDFGGVLVESTVQQNAYFTLPSIESVFGSWNHYLFTSMPNHFGILLMLFIAMGIAGIRRINNLRVKVLLWASIGIFCMLIVGYLHVPTQSMTDTVYLQMIALTERMYLIGYSLFGICIGIGMAHFYTFVRKFASKMESKMILIGTGLLLLSLQLLRNYPVLNMSSFSMISDWAQDVIANAESAVVLCFDDISCFSLMSATLIDPVENYPLIYPITPQLSKHLGGLDQELFGYDYEDNPFRISDLISWNSMVSDQPVMLADVTQYYADYLGLDGSTYQLAPVGPMHQISCRSTFDIEGYTSFGTYGSELAPFDERHSYFMLFKEKLAQQHALHAHLLAKQGYDELAQEHILDGLLLSPTHSLLTSMKRELAHLTPNDEPEKELCINTEQMWAQVMSCLETGDTTCALTVASRMHWYDPKNLEIKMLLARVYYLSGFSSLGIREASLVLDVNPNYLEAEALIQEIRESTVGSVELK